MVSNMQSTSPDSMAAPGGHYSHAVMADGWIFVSGQLPIAADGTKLTDASFETQAQQALANVGYALQSCGATTQHLVSVRVYITDIAHWPAFNALYAQWAGTHRPARTVVPVPVLHYGLQIEVEAVARLTESSP